MQANETSFLQTSADGKEAELSSSIGNKSLNGSTVKNSEDKKEISDTAISTKKEKIGIKIAKNTFMYLFV